MSLPTTRKFRYRMKRRILSCRAGPSLIAAVQVLDCSSGSFSLSLCWSSSARAGSSASGWAGFLVGVAGAAAEEAGVVAVVGAVVAEEAVAEVSMVPGAENPVVVALEETG